MKARYCARPDESGEGLAKVKIERQLLLLILSACVR